MKLLARWHDVAGNRGWTISEAADPALLAQWSLSWSDLLKFEVTPVIDDEQLGSLLGGR